MKKCKNCGAEVTEGAFFCDECGCKVDNSNPHNINIFNMYKIEVIEGEEIIKESEINRACLIVPGIITGIGVFIFLLALMGEISYSLEYGEFYFEVLFAAIFSNPFLIIGAIWLAIRYIAYKNTDLIITNKRVFGKCGLISTVQMQSPISKIDTVSFSNGLIGKVLGYGTVIVSTTSSHFKFRFVSNAHELSNYIFRQLEINDKEMVEKQADAIAKAIKD